MRHYIKILDFSEEYARKVAVLPADWAKAVFEDITEKGVCLTTEPLVGNGTGPRVGLCGDTFYCEVGVDTHRPDTLFVSRIESADRRKPRSVPERRTGKFVLLGGSRYPGENLDPIEYLFGTGVPVEAARPKENASVALQRALGEAPAGLAQAWKPLGAAVAPATSPTSRLDAILAPWSRFGLARFARVSARQSVILNRQIAPVVPPDDKLTELVAVFDVALLNAVVARERSILVPLLAEIGALALPQDVRAAVWCGILAGWPALEVRRALHESAADLTALAASPEASRLWSQALIATMLAVGELEGDQSLVDRAQLGRDAPNELLSIAEWAAQLQFQPREPAAGADDERKPAPADDGATRAPQGTPSAPPVIDQWVLRLRVPDRELAKTIDAEIASRLASARELAAGAASVEGVRRLVEGLTALSRQLHEWLPRLPDPAVLDASNDEALAAYAAAHELLGASVDELIAKTPTPAEVQDVVRILRRAEALAHFPEWLGPGPVDGDRNLRTWALWLCDAEQRGRASILLAVAEEGGLRDLSLLRSLPDAGQPTDFEHHVRASLKSVFELEDELAELSVGQAAWLDAGIVAGEDRAVLVIAARALHDLRGRLNETTFASVVTNATATRSPAERTQRIEAYKSAVRFQEQNFGSSIDATNAQLDSWIARQGVTAVVPNATETAPHWDLTIEHSFFDTPPARAPLSFKVLAGKPYGRVLVPLAIETGHPGDYSLRLDVQVHSKGHQHWPSNWPKVSPETVEISRQSWTEVAPRRYRHALALEVPGRAPETASESLDLEITLRDAVRETVLSKTHRPKWDAIEPVTRPIKLVWPEAITTSYVETQPIGPQKKAEQIVARVESGSSFAVVAPRRFGKSTLVDYLVNRLSDLGYVVPKAIVCTEYYEAAGIDSEELWRAVSTTLSEQLEAGLRGGVEQGVPAPDAFDYVRRAARREGKKAIVLLFDESQVFFSKTGGPSLGDRLKDRLERTWSVPGGDDLVPVLMGFVGLPSLLERAGANLTGLLRPFEAKEMEEADLNRLLLRVTNDQLSTTREARQSLIDSARNLYLMRTLVEDLVERVNELGRRWATNDDVDQVAFALHSALRAGERPGVGLWLRDALNEAETINDWRPSREFPVALALAMARHQGVRRDEEILAGARKLLEAWCGEVKIASAAQISFADKQLDDLLDRLRVACILNRNRLSFRSELLEAWLVGQAREGYPRVAQDALIKAANVTIRTPEGAEPVGEGGEAQVFRFTEKNGVAKAMRRVQLPDEVAKQRFLETCASLSVLLDGEHKNEVGAQYIVDLEAIGFSAEADMEAVQIYRWIDGVDLGEKVGKLDAPLVADIGFRVAQALQLLHSKRIVHRDVRPKNIILSHADKRPVLIDFGMARLETSQMMTALPSEFSAPEVRSNSPRWSRAADVFGLAKTLRSLLRRPDAAPPDLKALLDECTADDPAGRPEARLVAERLRRTAEALQVTEHRRVFWDKLQRLAAPDRELLWFDEVLVKFQPRFEALHLGLHREEFERSAELADFLNQVLEARPVRGGAERIKLGNIKLSNALTGDRLVGNRSIEFLHLARNWANHGSNRRSSRQRILAQLQNPCDVDMRALVVAGAEEIQKALGLKALRGIVTAVHEALTRDG